MPDETNVPEIASQAIAILYDCLTRVFAVQQALEKSGVLSPGQVTVALQTLKGSPQLRTFQKKWGIADSEFVSDLDTLLRNYEGPVQ